MYKTVVIEYSPRAEDMAKRIEERANELYKEGFLLVTVTVTGSARAVMVLKSAD